MTTEKEINAYDIIVRYKDTIEAEKAVDAVTFFEEKLKIYGKDFIFENCEICAVQI